MAKKIFSLMLVICMVAAMLPLAFAQDAGVLAYDLNKSLTSGTKVKGLKYADTDNVWEWHSSYPETSGTANATAHKWGGIDTNSTQAGYWLAVKIKINEAGEYSAVLTHAKSKSQGGYGDVYLLPGNTTDVATALSGATPIGRDVCYYNASEDIKSTTTDLSDITVKKGNEGEHILVFYASKAGSTGYRMYPDTLTLTKKESEAEFGDEVDSLVSVSVLSEKNGSVSVEGEYEVIDEVEIGTEIKATATPDVGYAFAYWRNAAGMWLSGNATETFVINTNTAVIAVYDKTDASEDENVPVRFYNGNGSLIESKSVEKGSEFGTVKIANPSLTGYAFDRWSISDETKIEELTRAVALYVDSSETYEIKVGAETVASGKKYGDRATVSSESEDFSCWKLGEDIVSYEKSFSFDIYGNAELTEICDGEAEALPSVALDVINNEYFIIYNVPQGYTRIEAGILFGDGAAPSVGGFNSKASEKTGSGQFTAKPSGKEDNLFARGYLLFRDSEGAVRVIYTSTYEG